MTLRKLGYDYFYNTYNGTYVFTYGGFPFFIAKSAERLKQWIEENKDFLVKKATRTLGED
jgi:hypothetical protein